MGRRRLSASSLPEAAGAIIPDHPFPPELRWPFGRLDALSQDELRESAYEIFFAACRSSTTPAAGAGTRSAAGRAAPAAAGATSPTGGGGGAKNMAVTSRLKRALGLRARKTRPMVMASAEMMRRQMGVSEQTDGRLRKTLVRCLVGPQMSRKVESLVLPLELLRHLKPSDFSDAADHRAWQLRQLKVLEAGLVSHPSVPLDRGNNPAAAALIREAATRSSSSLSQPLDVRALSAAAAALSWRSVDACRWADGYPLNVHLYLALLRAVFDSKDETAVLDEVDELLELIRKTWNVLGLNRMAHDVCFTWLLFEKYVTTGQVEPGLLGAVLTMLGQLSDKQQDNGGVPPEPWHLRILAATLASMHSWAEDKLLDYHDAFGGDHGAQTAAAGGSSSMEKVVSLAVLAATMRGALGGDLSAAAAAGSVSADEQVERYIRSSVRRAFTRLHETGTAGKMDSMIVEVDEDPCETLMYVAAQTKELARVEREVYSRVLRQWHPCPTAVAAAALHGCFGALLKRHLSRMGGGGLSSESVRALQTASRLEKSLLHMTAEDGHQMMAMAPYDVESTILDLAKGWMDERLTMGAECVRRARDSESWNPRSKAEPYAQSAVDLMKLAKVTVDELLELQVSPPCRDELQQRLVNGIDQLVQQYALLVACAGPTKESYVPPLPPLTRCNQDSKLVQLWRKAAPPCQAGVDGNHHLNCGGNGDSKPRLVVARGDVRPATSRGTQRLYVRLNTLHYLLAVLHSVERTLGLGLGLGLGHPNNRRLQFHHARPTLDAACLHISELSAYRLVFLDSAHVLHQTLYQGVLSDARIRPTLRVMKQSLAFLASVLSDRAQPLAVREVLKASVEAFLTVLLAGGSGRAFSRADYGAVAEDLASLKRLFCTFGVAEEAIEREAAQAEGVVALMALSTDKLVDELLSHYTTTPADELPLALPPTTRRWSRSDPNTILRVLCYRDDEAASRFLKKAFDLPKRR
ncbi:unnamed protein product [Urochloa decumbens]|uniref:Uncharacterized protein n=1 Tax=Urochloa decumbens TaxID=240449 RepID=A0ABC9F8G0_9POAL